MSTQTRTAPRGGKHSKLDSVSMTKSQKNDAKSDPSKTLDNPKAQPTAEQMRIAQIIDKRIDDSKLKEKIKQVMDATRKTEDEVITALHDCDNDCDNAVNMLLEGEAQGEWETSGKKKKNRQPGTKGNDISNNKNMVEIEVEEEPSAPPQSTERERSRNRGGAPRLRGRGGNDNRNSGRGRENKENEQNAEDGFARNRGDGNFRRGGRGMSNGPGGRSGRGGRSGGRLGSRTFQSRDKSGGGSFPRSIETWNNPPGPDSSGENNLKMENWGDDFTSPEDWDNEEYTGSLADSKVFTPSGGVEAPAAPEPLQDSSNQEMMMSNTTQDYHQNSQLPPSPLPVGVGSLNAAQTQYLSQLTAQSENLKSAVGIGTSNNSYGQSSGSTYGQNSGPPTAYGQTDNLKSAVGSSVSYNQASSGNTYQSTGSSGSATYGQTNNNTGSYGPSSGSAGTAYGQTTGYGQSGQSSYGGGTSTSSGYGQTAGGYGQSVTGTSNYVPQSQNSYGQSVANTSAYQSQSNANTYGQTGPGISNSSNYQSSSSGSAYSGTSASANTYQGSGSGTNVYQASANSGSGSSYQTSGSASAGSTGTSVYPVTGSQGSNSYQNSSSQNVNYQGSSVSAGNYSTSTGPVPGGNNTYQSGSTSFHSGNQPSVYTSQSYSNTGVSTYGTQLPDGSVTGADSVQSSQPVRTKTQRARVPPPSKIPQSAVEMPDDSINTSISFLDVQFGGLEFGSEGGTFENSSSVATPSTASETTPTPTNTDTQNSALDGYSTTSSSSVKNNQATLVSALTAKSVLNSNEALTIQSSSEHKTSFSTPSSRVASSSSGLDLSKSDVGLSYSTPSSVNYQSYQSQKTNSASSGVYQQTGYSTSNYSSSTPQVTSSSTSYSTNQSQSSNYNSQSPGNNSFPNSSYSQSSNAGVSYPNTGNTYQSSNSYPNSNQSYQSSGQSVYGSALSSGYPSTNQYQNNYGASSSSSSSQNKLNSALTSSTKDSQEYTASTTVANLTSTTNSGLGNTTLTSSAQTVSTTSTKVSSATTKSSVIANIPPGVPPIMGTHQYIMSQGGLPYFQAPTMYSFEELQLLQQRIPHMATGYYDMSYQAPTSLATGRDSMASVAYTMSDARYTRGDNNASPVPSTMSQQTATQAHQQPLMNHPSLPPGYAYFYGTAGMMPGSFQYGTPALYPLPAATNAHGSTTTSQYPKPGSYASAYGSGYEGLSQTQDYTKSAYVSTNQAQSKSGVGVTSGSSASSTADLNASMYGKSHTALGKVNSYEKQGFHSGTPPPFNLAGNQNTGMAPSGAYGPQLFIPTMAPHQQHHSTTLMHQPHHQDSGSSAGPRTQSSSQPNKSGSKQNYNAYWPQTMN